MKKLFFLSLLSFSLSISIKTDALARESEKQEIKKTQYDQELIIAALKLATIICHSDKIDHPEFENLVDHEKCTLVKSFLLKALPSLTPKSTSKTNIQEALIQINEEPNLILRKFKMWHFIKEAELLESLEQDLAEIIPGLKS